MTELEAEKTALIDALLSVDRLKVMEILSQPHAGDNPIQLVENLISPALEWIGIEWEQGRLSLSQVYMSGRICEEMVSQLMPPNPASQQTQPKMAIAVLEDYHALGKRIVYSMLRANGYALKDYGRVTVDELVKNITNDQIEIMLISVLMLPSALRVKDLRQRLDQAGIKTKIIVGGAPFRFDEQLWIDVGADACGKSASDALQIVRTILGGTD
jgi:methanogenic corrinoid protein MtbC1